MFPSTQSQGNRNFLPLQRLLEEVTYTLQDNLFLHLISNINIKFKEPRFAYHSYSTNFKFVKKPIFFLMYFFSTIYAGTKIIKRRREIHIVGNASGHVYQGFIAYLISRLTGRKCLLRVNEDTVLSAELFFKQLRTLNNQLLIKIILKILRKIEIFLFIHSDWIVTHGPMDYERIKRLTNKCSFIPLPIDTLKFKPILKNELSNLKKKIAGKNKVILFIGRLAPIKRLEYLLFALKNIIKMFPNSVLLVIGSGPKEKEYKNLARILEIEKNVKFMGYINHDNLPEYYNIADVYVLPSLREELSNTIMEAMACGVPVIATEVGGNPYLIEDGITGLLVSPKDIHMLSKKITFILKNPREASSISRKALKKIRKIAKIDVSEKYMMVLSKLVK